LLCICKKTQETRAKSQDNFYIDFGSASEWISDTTFLYAGSIYPELSPPDDERIAASILDTTYSALKETDFGKIDTIDYPAYNNCIAYYNDTTIYIVGFVNYIEFWSDTPNVIEIYRIDTSLNLLASADYSPDANHGIRGAIATNDGGCLVYGSSHAPDEGNEYDIYVLKIDPNDLLVSTNTHIKPVKNIEFNVEIFPNPTNNYLHFSFKGNYVHPTKLIIQNIKGIVVLEDDIEICSENLKIDCSNLIAGTYFYFLMNGNKILNTGKFINQ